MVPEEYNKFPKEFKYWKKFKYCRHLHISEKALSVC